MAGFYTNCCGLTSGFLITDKKVITLNAPGASTPMALGVNDRAEVVGIYTPSGTTALDGFTWTPHRGFTTVNDPHGVGTTTINGVNDFGDLIGFYVDSAGNTNGMLARPRAGQHDMGGGGQETRRRSHRDNHAGWVTASR